MKKTGIDKVTGRKPLTITYKVNILKQAPFKELLVIRNFTSKH